MNTPAHLRVAAPAVSSTPAASGAFRATGANGERTRRHNRRLVLGHVRAAGNAGRAEIARGSALSVQAVGNIVAELEADGLLVEAGRRSVGRGQPAMQYRLNAAGGHALGAEVRPDALLVTLVDLAGYPLYQSRESLRDARPANVAKRLSILRSRAVKHAALPNDTLLGAGIVMPGPFGEFGVSRSESELASWRGVDRHRLFSETLGLDVFVENDANAAAMGERIAGVAHRLDSYAFVYFGAGVGLGVVHHGRLFRGARGNAGEIGHVSVLHAGKACPLEDVASRFALQRRLAKAGRPTETADALGTRHASRDPAVLAWLDVAVPAVSQAIHTIENLFDPDAVILGGALPDALLDEMIARLPLSNASVAQRPERSTPRVLRGRSGRMTATLGGAALVLNKAFTPQLDERWQQPLP